MKLKNYVLLSGIALFTAACSSNDDNNSEEMTLKRVEEYYPSKEEYDDPEWQFGGYKDVKYYENGEVVLDSFFNGATGYYSRDVIQTTGNTKVMTHYNANNIAELMTSYEFDFQGRLIKIKVTAMNESSSDRIENFSYNANGTITQTIQRPQSGQEQQFLYSTNTEGRINGSIYEGTIQGLLVYQSGNIISVGNDNTLTYYDIKKPSNFRMNIIEANNYLLTDGWYGSELGTISDNYVKIKTSQNNTESYQSTFNDSGYILNTIWSGIIPSGTGTKEIFYYYN